MQMLKLTNPKRLEVYGPVNNLRDLDVGIPGRWRIPINRHWSFANKVAPVVKDCFHYVLKGKDEIVTMGIKAD